MTLSHKTQLEQFNLAPQQASGLTKEAMDKLKAEYMKTQLQMAQQQQIYTSNNTGNVTLPYPHYQNPIPIEVPTENLNEGAWDVPISQLVDLWTVRYGSKWVNDDELDEFYEIAAKRLRALHKVESHYVNGNDVFRIVE
jgi:hypothetical protein